MSGGVQSPYSSEPPVPINSATLASLERKSVQTNLFGGFTEDGSKAWIVRGPVLEVVDAAHGERSSCHHFDVATGDPAIHITSIREFVFRGAEAFLVGLRSEGGKGLVCVYEFGRGKVVMAVAVPYGVTSVEVVTERGGIDAPNYCLSPQMQKFFGMAAVGTDRGHLYLLDMRVDERDVSSEKHPRESKVVTLETQYIENLRLSASNKGQHLCLEINASAHSYFAFQYQRPDNESLRDYSPDGVFVSNVTYLAHTGTLAVGFNFGCFQLWQLAEAVLEYSSPVTPQVTPVSFFASQEPTDDPQFFCYLWIGRGPLPWESSQDVSTDVHLFQLAYEEKTYHGSHGHLFRELNNCIPRFFHNLTHDPFLSDEDLSLGSRLIGCWTLEKVLSQEEKEEEPMDDGDDENYTPTDRTLTAFLWEGRPETPDGQLESSYFLAVFDLNQWYYAQMPARLKHSQPEKGLCKYFAFYSLASVRDVCTQDFLLNLHINPAGMSRYQSTTPAMLELHQQPTALSFDATCLMETATVSTSILGLQEKVLAEMTSQGPMILREPAAVFARCSEAQLLTRFGNLVDGGARLNLERQREALLTVTLENDQLSFILRCIDNWSQGDFSSGISLRALMEWAWRQVTERKQMIDNMCEPFFDGGGTFIGSQTIRRLAQCSVHYHHLLVIFKALLTQSETTTEQGAQDLSTKLVVLSLLAEHLKAVLWFVRVGLLPECSDKHIPVPPGQFSYPITLLRHAYHQRRSQLQKLSRSDSSPLLIDGIIEEAGLDLSALWQRKDEDSDGLYPPPSLYALLDIYLMETVPLLTKQCIVGYMMLDIESTLNGHKDQQLSEHIRMFDSAMDIPLGLTKLVHAFWLLDHRDFAEAINMLLHPMTDTISLSPWQHSAIIRSFLYHDESKRALQYVRAVHPPRETPDDIKLHLTVLLANGLTSEAFFFQRDYHDDSTSEELLYHLFLGSQQTKTMKQLLQLPFNEMEEMTLRQYLEESSEPNSQEVLVMHLIQRAQFVEATRLNSKLNQQMMMMEAGPAARERALSRNSIVEKCKEVMPGVQRKLAFNPEVKRSRIRGTRHEVPRPKPLSTKINPAKSERVLSHGFLMSEVLNKIAEARECMEEEETTPANSPLRSLPSIEPFVGTPITPSSKSRRRYSTAFVYPDPSDLNASNWQPTTAPSDQLMNRARLLSQGATPKSVQPTRRMTSNYSGADAMSLLQTPIVQKKTPRRSQVEQPPAHTPQSILRVRQVVRRSPSPAKQTEHPLPPPEVFTGLPEFPRLPTPPAIRRHLSSRADEEEGPKAPPTPQKHLRFTEDTRGDTPSPIVPMESSSSEASPIDEECSTPREGPSPVFGTPPSGSPTHMNLLEIEPQTTMEEQQPEWNHDDDEEIVQTGEPSLLLPPENPAGMPEFPAGPPSYSAEDEGLPTQEESEEVIMLESDVEEEFYDVENTEDLAVRTPHSLEREIPPAGVRKEELDVIPEHEDPERVIPEGGDLETISEVLPPRKEEMDDNPSEQLPSDHGDVDDFLADDPKEPEAQGFAPSFVGSGDVSHISITSSPGHPERMEFPKETEDLDIGAEPGLILEPDVAMETDYVAREIITLDTEAPMETGGVVMETRESDEEDLSPVPEQETDMVDSREGDPEVTFNFDPRSGESAALEEEDTREEEQSPQEEMPVSDAGSLPFVSRSKRLEVQLSPLPSDMLPKSDEAATSEPPVRYSSDDLPRPPIHPLPAHIEEKYGSPPSLRSSPAKQSSPQRSFVLPEVHPFPTPPQRTHTEDDDEAADTFLPLPLPLAPLTSDHGDGEIQTSPFTTDVIPPHAAADTMADTSSQTTPGLGLLAAPQTPGIGMTEAPQTPGTAQKRAPFGMSLRSHHKNAAQPSPIIKSVEESEENTFTYPSDNAPVFEPLTPVVSEVASSSLYRAPSPEPVKSRSPEPESVEVWQAQRDEPSESEGARDKTPKGALPFIFSPPSTRSRSRRQTISVLHRATRGGSKGAMSLLPDPIHADKSLLPAGASPLLPEPSPARSTRRGRRSLTPTSSPAILDASLTRPRRGRRSMTPTTSPAVTLGILDASLTRPRRSGRSMTPTTSPAENSEMDTSLTQSTRRGRRSVTPTNSPAIAAPDQAGAKKVDKPSLAVPKKVVTRSRGKSLISREPTDSPLNLISPIKEEEEVEGVGPSKPTSRRVVRVPRHSMSLRNTGKTTRTVKLF